MKVDEGNYPRIRRETLERYLLDMLREFSKEEERLYLHNHGEPMREEFREISFAGEGSPIDGFVIRTYYRRQDVEENQHFPLYGNPDFFDKDGKRLSHPADIVGDILMWARGG